MKIDESSSTENCSNEIYNKTTKKNLKKETKTNQCHDFNNNKYFVAFNKNKHQNNTSLYMFTDNYEKVVFY